MPSVDEISRQVFSGEGVIRHGDATYYLSGRRVGMDEYYRARAAPAIAFADRLRGIADRYFADFLDGRSANYEDVANFAKQISDAISGEYENPALLPLLVELRSERNDVDELRDLAEETRNYVRDTVWRMLSQPVERVDHLAPIIDGCRALGAVDVFELNHDRVLSTALADAGLAASDGFSCPAGDVFVWTDQFDQPVRHFSLHGSITWFHRRLADEPWQGLAVARSTTRDPYHEHGAAGELLEFPADGRPVLLTGTFDKPLSYDSTIFSDQHFRFQESLREADALVVIGYGFRDKAINSRVIGWLHSRRDRRLVVVHGKPDDLVADARDAIARPWAEWFNVGRLRIVEKPIEEATWAEIAEALSGGGGGGPGPR
jgi:hypothetical protein